MFLLHVWKEWSIYPTLFINGLEATFQKRNNDRNDNYNRSFSKNRIDTALNILKKLNHLNTYIQSKNKNNNEDSSSDDEDIDGVPITNTSNNNNSNNSIKGSANYSSLSA